MNKTISIFVFLQCIISFSSAQTFNLAWQKCIGGSAKELNPIIIARPDLSYTVGFSTNSSNGDIVGAKGGTDYYFTKYDKDGALSFSKSAGGSMEDQFSEIKEFSDGNYLAIGTTNSTDGNITNNHGGNDVWVTKIVGNGSIQWRKCIGGTKEDFGGTILEAADKSYIIAGTTSSSDGDISSNAGGQDVFLINTDINGIFQYTKTFGGTGDDKIVSISKLSDGYVLLCDSNSPSISGASNANKGKKDFLVIKTDLSGKQVWAKFYGGPDDDTPSNIITLSDGNLLLTGTSNSTSGDISGAKGGSDIWVLKINKTGSIIWTQNLGGTSNDIGKMAVEYATPNKYFIIGSTNSNNGNVSGNHGGTDIWVAKLSTSGGFEFGKTFGGSQDDFGSSLSITADNALLIAGESLSNDGNVTGNHGGKDVWVAKLNNPVATSEVSASFEMHISPNPASNSLLVNWNDNFRPSKISIFEMNGKLTKQVEIPNESKNIKLDISNISSGSYILTLSEKGIISSQKLEIVR